MRTPCDEAQIQSGGAGHPCVEQARPWILAATILGSSMAFIDSTVVNVALPAIQGTFHASVVDVQWVVESYGLFLGALILAGGALGDLFGRRLMFTIGVAIFALASLGCGVAATIHQLIVARSIQGFGAALLVPGSLAIISTFFDEKSRGQAIGTWSGFTTITMAIGPVMGGWLVEHASWRWAFFINLPLAAAVLAISIWRIPESRNNNAGRLDWLGTLLGGFGLGGLVFGFTESANLGWRNPLVVAGLTIGVGCLITFVVAEERASSPLVPLKLFQSPTFRSANLLTLFLYAALGIFFFLFPLNLIQVQRYSATATGAAMLPMILLMFLLSRWSGGLVARYGPRLPLIIGPLIAASGFVLLAVAPIGSSYWTTYFPVMIVLGFGMAVTVAPLTTTVMNSVDQERVGAASGINNAVARVAGVLAIAVFGMLMVHAFSSRLNQQMSSLSLPANVVHEVQANEIKLAGLQVPAGVDPEAKSAIDQSVKKAFVFGFRIVLLICVGLGIASAAVTGVMIRG